MDATTLLEKNLAHFHKLEDRITVLETENMRLFEEKAIEEYSERKCK